MAASILFNGLATPQLDLAPGTVVTATNFNNTGIVSWAWTIVDKPPGSTAALSSASAANPTFTVDVEGSYLLSLTVNAGLGDELTVRGLAAVRQVKTGARIPAASETSEADANDGWAVDVDALLRALDATRGDPNLQVAVNTDGVARSAGEIVYVDSVGTILTGLPGEEVLLGVKRASAADTTHGILDPLYIVVGTPAGASSVPAGDVAVLRRAGLMRLPTVAGAVAGAYLYLSNGGVLTTNPANYTIARPVARVAYEAGGTMAVHLHPSTGWVGSIVGDLYLTASASFLNAGRIDAGGHLNLNAAPGSKVRLGDSGGTDFWEVNTADGSLNGVGGNMAIHNVLDPVGAQDPATVAWVQRNYHAAILVWGNENSGNAAATVTYIDPGYGGRTAPTTNAPSVPVMVGGTVRGLAIQSLLTSTHDDTVVFSLEVLRAGVFVATGLTVSLGAGVFYAEDTVNTEVIAPGEALMLRALSGAAQTLGVQNFVASVVMTLS